MSAYDFCLIFFLQPDGKTILLGTQLGKMKEFNLMTGQVRENLFTLLSSSSSSSSS